MKKSEWLSAEQKKVQWKTAGEKEKSERIDATTIFFPEKEVLNSQQMYIKVLGWRKSRLKYKDISRYCISLILFFLTAHFFMF